MFLSVLLQFCALHPLLLMFLLTGLMLAIFYKTPKKYVYHSNIAWLLPVFGVVNFIWGDDWNAAYVNSHGKKGQGVVTEIVPTHTWINRVREVEYTCLVKTADGQKFPVSFVNDDRVFYPKPKLWMPPAVGETFDVRYIPGNESNFVILTADRGSAYANKLSCMVLLQRIASVQAAYNLDPSDAANKNAYVKLLKSYLARPCDEHVKKAYMLLLERIESGEL